MRKIVRTAIVAAIIGAPFIAGSVSSPAQATCDPRKPSTCGCPYGWDRVGPFCLPTGTVGDIIVP